MSEPLDILYNPQPVKSIFLQKQGEDARRELVELEYNFYFRILWIEEVLNHLRKAGAENIKSNLKSESESDFTANLNGSTLIRFLKIYIRSENLDRHPLAQIIREISPEDSYQLFCLQTLSEPLLTDDE
ncbi:MAG: hypothetical protein K2H29_06965 [Oscillospiraceae bacterium]|nr:hypothetical protein [Oscillospiraceae bacterium]